MNETRSIFSSLRLAGLLIINILTVAELCAQTSHTGIRDITGLEVAAEMAPGLNLFNTLDANGSWQSGLDTETMWGQPFTTPEIVKAMADRGFKSLRIPVTWYNHMGAGPDYTIDKEWMDRVEEVANYAFDNNMYVILNIHHDDLKSTRPGTWLTLTYDTQDAVRDQLVKVWTQIANRFKDYGDYLIFETLNEPREPETSHEWSTGTEENRSVLNALNLAAVNAIRATGGNNAERFISVPQYAASPTAAIESMVIPNDDAKVIVAIHYYAPVWFCLNLGGQERWGTPEEYETLENDIKSFREQFNDKGQAVYIGECGASNQDNYGDRIMYFDAFSKACEAYDITPIFWMYDFDRPTLTWVRPLIEDAIIHTYDPSAVYAEEITLNKTADTLYVGETLQLNASILPADATSQEIGWTTYNDSLVSVSSTGMVKANVSGFTTITATTIGQTAACNLLILDTVAHFDFHIEAEDFIDQFGIKTENCQDADGGVNIAHIENGDWSSYFIVIDSAGGYDFTARVATNTGGGSIEILANNIEVGEVAVVGTKSNGWQDWYTTDPKEIHLEKGIYELKLNYKGSSGYLFNVNWVELSYNDRVITSLTHTLNSEDKISIYPNPAEDYLTIASKSMAISNIELVNMSGQTVLRKEIRSKGDSSQLDLSSIKTGLYILKVARDEGVVFRKVVVK